MKLQGSCFKTNQGKYFFMQHIIKQQNPRDIVEVKKMS